MGEINSYIELRNALDAKVLLGFDTPEALLEYLKSVRNCDFIVHNGQLDYLEYSYICDALINLAKMVGSVVYVKSRGHEKRTVTYDFVQDCIPYVLRKSSIEELSVDYSPEEVFKARLAVHIYKSKYETLKENISLFKKFGGSYSPYKMFTAVFSATSSSVIADMDSEEFIAYLSTCDVDEQSKSIIEALFNAIHSFIPNSSEYRTYAVEDLFIRQSFIAEDTRIPAELRSNLALVQVLAYDDELCHSLKIGWSNAIDGIYTKELIS